MVRGQSRYWCFTINNYTPDDVRLCESLHPISTTFIIIGKEVGENGTRHLQGYIELPRRLRLNQVSQLFNPLRPHFESRRGTAQQARDYCAKDNDFTEFGELSQAAPGQRNDLIALREYINTGATLADIAENHFSSFLRYERSIRAYRNMRSPQRTWITEIFVKWGVTGSGKTRSCHQHAEENGGSLYIHPGGSWFDGYDGHSLVLFDDFSGACFKLPYLLKLLDRYPMQVPIKGGFVSWAPTKVFITSNIDPAVWYPNAHPEHVAALRRRFTEVTHYNGIVGQDILIVNN